MREFWERRATENPDRPCHYLNEVMDEHAWRIRVGVFFKFVNVVKRRVCDLCCGDGRWLVEFCKRGAVKSVGVEFSRRLADLATARTSGYDNVIILNADAADQRLCNGFFQVFDVVTMITGFQFIIPDEKRMAVLHNAYALLGDGGVLAILDYMPNKVPKYQKGLGYKIVWPVADVLSAVEEAGFVVKRVVPVNWVDTTLFHYFGRTGTVAVLSSALESLIKIVPSFMIKYRLVVAERR